MNKDQYLLQCLIEGCSEVQKSVIKVLMFGKTGRNPEDPGLSNLEELQWRLVELAAAIQLLDDTGTVSLAGDHTDDIKEKKERISRWYERAKGMAAANNGYDVSDADVPETDAWRPAEHGK